MTTVALFLVALAINLTRICPGVFADDSPETVTACLSLGIAHPPGDPLLALLGRIWIALVPTGSIAWRINLMSSTLGAGVVLVAWKTATHRLTTPTAISIGAIATLALLTFNPMLAQQCATAKGSAYTLNLLLIALAGQALLDRKPLAAALTAGLLCGHHWMTMAAFTPALVIIGITAAARTRWDGPLRRRTARQVMLATCLVALGISLWLFLPIRAVQSPALNWGRAVTAKRFTSHVTRQPFLERELKPSSASLWRQASAGLTAMHAQTGSVAWIAVAIGFWSIFSGWPALALAAIAAILSPWATACVYLDLPPHLMHLLGVFLLPSGMILAIVGARGISSLAARGGRGECAIALAICAGIAASQLSGIRLFDVSRYTWSHDTARAILAPLPMGAGLIVASDLDTFPLWHAQNVENYRPDVLVVNHVLLRHAWYREIIGLSAAYTDEPGIVRALMKAEPRPWFSSPGAVPGIPYSRARAYHFTAHLPPFTVPASPPRGITLRGTLERARHWPEAHSQVTVGYTLETIRNLESIRHNL